MGLQITKRKRVKDSVSNVKKTPYHSVFLNTEILLISSLRIDKYNLDRHFYF